MSKPTPAQQCREVWLDIDDLRWRVGQAAYDARHDAKRLRSIQTALAALLARDHARHGPIMGDSLYRAEMHNQRRAPAREGGDEGTT